MISVKNLENLRKKLKNVNEMYVPSNNETYGNTRNKISQFLERADPKLKLKFIELSTKSIMKKLNNAGIIQKRKNMEHIKKLQQNITRLRSEGQKVNMGDYNSSNGRTWIPKLVNVDVVIKPKQNRINELLKFYSIN
jgi:hypothetical protein